MVGFRADTNFITRNGITSFSNFKNKDIIEIISSDRRYKKAEIVSCGIQKLYRMTFHNLLGKYVYVYTSLDQKWLHFNKTCMNANVNDILFPIVDVWRVLNIEEYRECEAWSLHVEDGDSFILENNIVCCGC